VQVYAVVEKKSKFYVVLIFAEYFAYPVVFGEYRADNGQFVVFILVIVSASGKTETAESHKASRYDNGNYFFHKLKISLNSINFLILGMKKQGYRYFARKKQTAPIAEKNSNHFKA